VSTRDVGEALAAIAMRPDSEWPALVAKLPDELRTQALIWLRANRERLDDDEATPALEGDRYELGVLLDVGATASVWQAHDAKLGRNVAIKVFRGERSAVIDEILAEARAAAEVTSDHVVRVLDVHGADPPYIVMELVGEWEPKRGVLAPGGSAAAIRPRSDDEAVRWVRDVARGVHDAHLRNVFHRDLKPHNVLITPFSRRARIADFGLAVSDGHETSVASGTIDGTRDRALQIAGTPGYIAPEQASGLPQTLDPHDLDERAVLVGLDVWGLGALAFDLLAGRPPWQAEADLEPWELAASATDAPELPRSLPRRLRRIVGKALAIAASDRYATAGELADDLDAYLAREPTSHDSSRAARFWLWCRRNPQLTITVGLATALAAISGGTYMQIVEVGAQRNALAVEARKEALDNAELQAHGVKVRAELAATEHELDAKNAELEQVKQTLTDADKEYEAIVAANERALADASAATRALADQLAQAHTERDTAKFGRKLYEDFWNRARLESEQADRDRDQAQRDRDGARDERDKALEERDAAVDARTQVEQERDRALADRDRAEAIRRRIEGDLAKVTAQLAALKGLPAPQAKPSATPSVQAQRVPPTAGSAAPRTPAIAPAAGSAAPPTKPAAATGSATPPTKPAAATGSAAPTPTLATGSDATPIP
jgi:tRNA A-37 threonylcarbamoyl transferase component Bud32